MSEILVVDDEVGIRELLSEILREEGHRVRLAESASQARSSRSQSTPDLVLLDIWMPDSDGVTLLKEWASTGQLTMPVVMMSGHGTIDTAVEATRIGAYGFLEKPIALQKLLSTVGSALARGPASERTTTSFVTIGKSPAVVQLREQIERLGKLRGPVLFVEPPGAGANQCARLLRKHDERWVEVASPAQFDQRRHELAQLAHQGIVYLRDVQELSREQQYALLATMSDLEASGTRLLSSTTVSLPERIVDGSFEPRLYAVIAGTIIRVPALYERSEDIPELIEAILAQLLTVHDSRPRSFTMAALNMLRNYHWPGNLVQVQTVVQSCLQLASGSEIGIGDVTNALADFDAAVPLQDERFNLDRDLRAAREEFERVYFEYHLSRENGNMSRVASRAGLERTHLYRKIKQLGIKPPRRSED
ncbi:MAG: sigma-54-dependent Fis family transcriptional regulator [Betaproteobacteria bacterium]|nr:MAG: sigma-54-dependent Fis family transcriptional regulator [Betaproteobacteria bacterium]